jgi:hypothetical protein
MQLHEAQRRRVVKKIRGDFDRFWDLVVESGDSDFLKYVYALIFRVYEMHLDEKYMTKTQACRYIPLKHAATCKKYLDVAERKGFFCFEPSATDARKSIVKPGAELLNFVEATIHSSLEEMSEIVADSSAR